MGKDRDGESEAMAKRGPATDHLITRAFPHPALGLARDTFPHSFDLEHSAWACRQRRQEVLLNWGTESSLAAGVGGAGEQGEE